MNPLAYSLVPEDGHNATNDAVGYYTYLKEALAAKAKIPSADTGKTRRNVCDALKEEGVVVYTNTHCRSEPFTSFGLPMEFVVFWGTESSCPTWNEVGSRALLTSSPDSFPKPGSISIP